MRGKSSCRLQYSILPSMPRACLAGARSLPLRRQGDDPRCGKRQAPSSHIDGKPGRQRRSAIEWFDYFLYGTLAAQVFGRLFFPTHDPVVGVMLAYLTFSLTFLVRPLGGVIFAHVGDRIGRKAALVATLTLMGLLPTYNQIGFAAPALLILLRIVQGIGIGGEWGGALLLAWEQAPSGRRGLFASVPQLGVTLGMLLSTLSVSIVSLLPNDDFLAWGWRWAWAKRAARGFLPPLPGRPSRTAGEQAAPLAHPDQSPIQAKSQCPCRPGQPDAGPRNRRSETRWRRRATPSSGSR